MDCPVSSFVKELGAIVFFRTRGVASAMKFDCRIAMVCRDKIVWEGPTGSIQTCGNSFVEQFIEWQGTDVSWWKCFQVELVRIKR